MRTAYALTIAATTVVLMTACGAETRSEADDKVAPGKSSTVTEVSGKSTTVTDVPTISENDDRIESTFKKSYVYTSFLKGEKIEITSEDGNVLLTGSVEDADSKPLAGHIAAALPGVKSVNNSITIIGDPHAERSDGWIHSRVRMALQFNRNLNEHRAGIKVADGVVTLSGVTASQAHKDLATEYANDVDGVKEVRNEMIVAEAPEQDKATVGEYVDDASITAQVKMSLLVHRSTSAMTTGVETIDGVVTLSGEAKNQVEKDLVTKLVNDISGVKSIVNNMSLEKVPA